MTEKSTEELLTIYLQTHNNELMGLIYKRLQEPMYALALRFVRSPDDAEDIVQDVFLQLTSTGPQEIKSAKSFVFRIVKNLSLNHRRKEKRHRRKLHSLRLRSPKKPIESDPDFEHDEDSPDDIVDVSSPSPGEELERQDTRDKVEKALDRLPAKQRQAAMAFFGNGLTSEETGRLIGVKAARGYKYARQGVNNLRKILAPDRIGHGIRRDGVANAI